jgi:TP901 family phage tail tape measure protein
MSLLGDWIARIIVDVSSIGPELSRAEGEWAQYYRIIRDNDAKTTEFVKRALKDRTGAEIQTRKQASDLLKQMNKEDLAEVRRHVNDLVSAEKIRTSELKKQAAEFKKQTDTMNHLKSQMASFASIAITLPIMIGSKKAIDDFMEFTQEMQNIRAVIGGTSEDISMLSTAAMKLGEVMSKSPADVARAMFELGQAGLNAVDIYNEIAPVMQLSAAGMKDLSFTAELVVTSLKAFGLGSDQAARVADVFSSSNAKSVSSLDKLNASLKYTAGLWSSMGWDIESLVGTLDTLYDTGVRGEKAGRLLASALNGLQRPTRSAKTAIKELLGSYDALDPSFNKITDIIKKMADAHATSRDIVKIFGKESAEVINRLVQNYGDLGGNIAEVSNQTGETAKQAMIQLDSLKNTTERLNVTMKNVGISFGKTLDPAIRAIVNTITAFMKAVEKLPDWAKALISSFIAVMAISGPLALAINKISVALAAARSAALLTGAAFSIAFAPMAIIAAGATVLGAGYVYLKKVNDDYMKSIEAGASSMERQGKNIDDMVYEIRKLYATAGDSSEVTRKLQELSSVFPALRNQLTKNAGDTAAAMGALNKEYAALKDIQAKRLGNMPTPADAIAAELQSLKANAASTDAELNKVWGMKMASKTAIPMISSLRKEYANFSIASEAAASGQLTFDKLMREGALFKNFKFVEAMKENEAAMRIWLNSFVEAALKEKMAEGAIDDFNKKHPQVVKVPVDFSQVTKMVENLDDIITKAMTDAAIISFKFDVRGAHAGVEDILASIKNDLDTGMPELFAGNQASMQKLGFMDESGELTKFYKKELDKALPYVDDLIKQYGGGFINALMSGKNTGPAMQEAASLLSEFAKNEAIVRKGAGDDADPDKAQKQYDQALKRYNQIRTQLTKINTASSDGNSLTDKSNENLAFAIALLNVIYNKSEMTKKATKEHYDWWDKIVKDIQGSVDLLQGSAADDISSLTKRMKELSDKSSGTYKDILNLASGIQKAFQSNPELKSMAGFIELKQLMDIITAKFKGMASAQAEAFGIPVPVNTYYAAMEIQQKTLDILEKQKATTDTNSDAYLILSAAVDKTKEAITNLQHESGTMDDFTFSSGQFGKKLVEDKTKADALRSALERFSTLTIDQKLYTISEIDPGNTISKQIDAFNELQKAYNTTSEELKGKMDVVVNVPGAGQIEGTNEKIKSLKEVLAAIKEKKLATIKLILDGAAEAVNNISAITVGLGDMLKASLKFGKDADFSSFFDSFGKSLTAMAPAITAVAGPAAGAIVGLVGVVSSSITAISTALDQTDVSAIKLGIDIQNTYADIAAKAESALAGDFLSVGDALGKKIMEGIKDGTVKSAADVTDSLRTSLYDMMAEQVLSLSGFKEKIATIAENLWAELSPGAKEKANLKLQINALKEQVASLGNREILTQQVASLQKSANDASSTSEQRSQLNAMITATKSQISLIDAYNAKLGELQGQYDALGTTTVSPEIQTEAIAQATTEMSSLIDQLTNLRTALGLGADGVNAFFDKIAAGLEDSLVKAVLTGSYVDFKKAVYDQIVTSVIDAIIQAKVVKNQIQAILDSIFDTSGNLKVDANGNIDSAAIIQQIRDAWIGATDETSPIGQLLMALRSSLSDFGLMNVNVNPATVVTAIPGDVRDDLIQAIRGTMQSLSDAIAAAGLNSQIDIVNITTAYITAMSASQILITQANLTLTGSMVFQMNDGMNLNQWLEDWMSAYIARSI